MWLDYYFLFMLVYGESHGETINALHELASVYDNQLKYDEAKPLYELCLKLLNESCGMTEDTLACMNNLALLYSNIGNRKTSIYLDVFMYECICGCMFVLLFLDVCMYVSMYVCMYIYFNVLMSVF